MKAQEIKDRLVSCGWVEDRFGHMKKDLAVVDRVTKVQSMVPHRMKFQKTSIRFERLVTMDANFYREASKTWFLRCSAYMKDIKLDDTGALAIGNYRFKAPL